MYYVSFITQYPIYEAAEGGYYYSGTSVEECREFSSWKKANRYYQKMRKWFLEDYSFWVNGKTGVSDYQCGCVNKRNHPVVRCYSRYVGEDAWVQLTRTKPQEHGWHPYC